jgi:hypothetical protein
LTSAEVAIYYFPRTTMAMIFGAGEAIAGLVYRVTK